LTGSGARDGLIAACAASIGIHVALAPEHLREQTPIGIGFCLSAAMLAVTVIGLLRRPAAAWPAQLAALTLVGLVAGYVVTRVVAVPGVVGTPEGWDAVGIFSKVIELGGLYAAVRFLGEDRAPIDTPDPLLPVYVPVLVAVFAALLALSGGHHPHGDAEALRGGALADQVLVQRDVAVDRRRHVAGVDVLARVHAA
jgi:hypothetical protein